MGLVADPLGVQSVFLRSLDAVPGRDSRFHTGLAASGVLPTSLIFVTVSDQAGASPASVIDQVLPSWWSGKNSKREPGNGQRAHHDFHRLAEKSISRRADRLVSHLPLKSLIYASVSAGRCPPSPSPGHHSVSVTSVRTARSWTCDARRVGSVGPRGYSEKQKLVCCIPFGGRALLMLVGWTRRFSRRWNPPTVCTHNFAPTHSLSTPR